MSRLVSILIPTHNRQMLLAQVLGSLRALRMSEESKVEVIVVANGCTDDTEAIVLGESARMPFPTRCVVEGNERRIPILPCARRCCETLGRAGAD